MKQNITQEDIEKIKKKTLGNIVAKVRDGKVISKQEWTFLEEMKEAGEEVPEGAMATAPHHPKRTKSDKKMREIIIENYDISERKSYDWIKKLQHMKKSLGWPVADVLEAIQTRKDKSVQTGTHMEILELRKIEQTLKNELLQIKLDQEKGELIQVGVAKQKINEINTTVRNRVDAMPTQVAPLVAKESDPKICFKILLQAAKDLINDVHSNL